MRYSSQDGLIFRIHTNTRIREPILIQRDENHASKVALIIPEMGLLHWNTMNRSICLMFGLLLSGCNGIPTPFVSDAAYKDAFMVTSSLPAPLLYQASAVQWNEDYAVSAKHTPYLSDVEHRGRGDVVFIKRKAPSAPHWRQASVGESVTAVGFNPLLMPVKGSGHVKESKLLLSNLNDGVLYSIHDGPSAMGMSGGPVYADDGSVVGITVAFVPTRYTQSMTHTDLADAKRVSVFMGYKEIEKKWHRFQGDVKVPAPVAGYVVR